MLLGFRYVIGMTLAAIAAYAAAGDDCLSSCPTRKGPFGQPEVDRNCVLRCLQAEEQAPGTEPRPDFSVGAQPSLRFGGNSFQSDRQALLKSLVNSIPDRSFRTWVPANVVFERGAVGENPWRAGVRPGRLTIYDSFWQLKRPAQESLLAFELAKALWFDRVNPGPREARPPREVEFEAIYRRHQDTLEAMRFAAWHNEDLSELTDRDTQSWFAYACRAAMFDLPAPSQPPRAYSPAEWEAIRRDWQPAKLELRRYMSSLLSTAPASP